MSERLLVSTLSDTTIQAAAGLREAINRADAINPVDHHTWISGPHGDFDVDNIISYRDAITDGLR
jgi:hypothetical protein